MYYCVTGKLIHVEPYLAVVSCGGVGYKLSLIHISEPTRRS